MKIALVCDWLTGMRGGEKCLQAICEIFPQADIFTVVYYPENFNGEFEHHRITTSFVQKLPGGDTTFRRYLPFFPKAIESFDLSGYDLVLSFSHCVAKGVNVPPGIPHICYCHTPMRYAWDMRQQYLQSMSRIKRVIATPILNRLKQWDIKVANGVGHYIANSRHVQQRIRQSYNRDSNIIYPPVDTDRFKVAVKSEGYYLILSAMVPYKRIDLAVQSFTENGCRLIIAGGGPEVHRLKSISRPNIEFVLNPDDQAVEHLYAGCRALIFPGQEDFGIVPLEAQACGKPVIAYGKGGALETVVSMDDLKGTPTGIFFQQQTPADLQLAIERFEKNEHLFTPQNCRRNAEGFKKERYQSEMASFIQKVMDEVHRSK